MGIVARATQPFGPDSVENTCPRFSHVPFPFNMSSAMTILASYVEKALSPHTLDAESYRKALQDSSWADVCRATMPIL